jgi:TonB family protein
MSFVFLLALAASAIPTKVSAPSASQNSQIGNPQRQELKQCPDGRIIPVEAVCAPVGEEPISASKARPASPLNHRSSWVTTRDYPARALVREMDGVSGIVLAVNKIGRVIGCSISQTSGFRELDEAACKSVVVNARFHPALDRRGNPANGSYSTSIRWQIPGERSYNSREPRVFPERTFSHIVPPRILSYEMLGIGIGDYPSDALADGEQGSVTVRAIVGADGKVVYCRIIASTTKSASPDGPLEKRSCEIVRKKWSFLPAEDGKGQKQASAPEFKFVWAIPSTEE